MSAKINFKVSSAIKDIVGRDLITNDFVAIFELVKNSVDAGAKKIDIFFDLLSPENSSIFIIDDGKGMSANDIREKWLFLGYSAKKEGTEDREAKIYAGNKGVGRFSCDRLGSKLKLQCKTKSGHHVNEILVDWEEFEKDAKREFEDVEFSIKRSSEFYVPKGIKKPSFGVVLNITGLREFSSWDRKKLLKLKSNLQKLINPFGDERSEFKICIHCPHENSSDKHEKLEAKSEERHSSLVNGPVENDILEVVQQKTTWINTRINEDRTLQVKLIDRGELIYELKQDLPEGLSQLSNSNCVADVYFLNRSAKTTFGRRMNVSSKDFGSLFLFRNGFRVFPVGEDGDDYWGLDFRKAQGHSRFLGNRDIMGKVSVRGHEKDFKESSSRDKGLIDTEASRALNRFVKLTVKMLERYVVGITWRDTLDKDYDNAERMMLGQNRSRIIELISDLAESKGIEVLKYNKNLIGILSEKAEEFEPSLDFLRNVAIRLEDNNLIKKVEKAESVLKKAKKAEYEALVFAEKEEKARRKVEIEKAKFEGAYEEEKKRNRFLVFSSTRDKDQLENFIHQMIYFAGHNRRLIQNQIKKLSKKKGNEWVSTLDAFYQLGEGIEKIITASRYLTSAEFRMKSGKIKDDIVSFIVEHLTTLAPMYTTGLDISIDEYRTEFVMKFAPIEVAMILDNLISNSKKARATKISFEINKNHNVLEVIVSDNGRGLAKNISEPSMIFEKGFTRSNGSGLGLFFCKTQMELLGGSISLTESQTKSGLSFSLKFIQQ